MKRVKKPKSNKITLSKKDIEKIKKEAMEEAVNKSMLLCIAAMSEKLKLNDDEICEIAKMVNRWAEFLDDHIITINEVAEIINKQTGIKFGRF